MNKKTCYGQRDQFWAIFVTRFYHSMGVSYHYLSTEKIITYTKNGETCSLKVKTPLRVNELDRVQPDFLSSALKFDSAEDALSAVVELQNQGVLPKTDMYGMVQVKVNEVAPYDSTRAMISILQRPLSDIEGNYRAWALEFWKNNPTFKYDNEHRYQVTRSNDKREYLKSTNPIEWTNDRTAALCLTKEECVNQCKRLNKEKLSKGYVQPQNLPAYHENPPKFHKGDIVKYGSSDEERKVLDIISLGEGWIYLVECDYKCGSYLYVEENFFADTPFSKLLYEEELTLVRKGE